MKDIFDECEFGKFTLNNRIITVNTYVIVNKNTFLKNEIIIATLNGIAVNNTL